ncbi:hypothetical protein [Pseudoxanthomonas indica]|uniref:Uncharacterized protein n=1 Tax=Pseudoxanthomonas indica TaxID=428993 RepID=A0A1T5KBG0_9GAMM|nr:hypothetical protein [Pseudoxanthomonas indica]GGD48204.1 hypothetical protein GCM10007235_20070 [Pseudoxanthomonas indica]SKC61021.1 hypothetical protein SAMN06296058_1545 [Pseudoxanthomonas indica]
MSFGSIRERKLVALACGYGLSIASRAVDHYKAWPEKDTAWTEWKPKRTWRGRLVAYALALLLAAGFVAAVVWLAG